MAQNLAPSRDLRWRRWRTGKARTARTGSVRHDAQPYPGGDPGTSRARPQFLLGKAAALRERPAPIRRRFFLAADAARLDPSSSPAPSSSAPSRGVTTAIIPDLTRWAQRRLPVACRRGARARAAAAAFAHRAIPPVTNRVTLLAVDDSKSMAQSDVEQGTSQAARDSRRRRCDAADGTPADKLLVQVQRRPAPITGARPSGGQRVSIVPFPPSSRSPMKARALSSCSATATTSNS